MIVEDSLTIVDDFVRILERVSRYFWDIYRFNIKNHEHLFSKFNIKIDSQNIK